MRPRNPTGSTRPMQRCSSSLRSQVRALRNRGQHPMVLEVRPHGLERRKEGRPRGAVERLQLCHFDQERRLLEIRIDLVTGDQERRQRRRGHRATLERRRVDAVHLEVRVNRARRLEVSLPCRLVHHQLVRAVDEQRRELEIGADLAAGLREHLAHGRGIQRRALQQLGEINLLGVAAVDQRDLREHSGRAFCRENSPHPRRSTDAGLPDEPRKHLRHPLAPFRIERALRHPGPVAANDVPVLVDGEFDRVRGEHPAVLDSQQSVRRKPLHIRVVVGELGLSVVLHVESFAVVRPAERAV